MVKSNLKARRRKKELDVLTKQNNELVVKIENLLPELTNPIAMIAGSNSGIGDRTSSLEDQLGKLPTTMAVKANFEVMSKGYSVMQIPKKIPR